MSAKPGRSFASLPRTARPSPALALTRCAHRCGESNARTPLALRHEFTKPFHRRRKDMVYKCSTSASVTPWTEARFGRQDKFGNLERHDRLSHRFPFVSNQMFAHCNRTASLRSRDMSRLPRLVFPRFVSPCLRSATRLFAQIDAHRHENSQRLHSLQWLTAACSLLLALAFSASLLAQHSAPPARRQVVTPQVTGSDGSATGTASFFGRLHLDLCPCWSAYGLSRGRLLAFIGKRHLHHQSELHVFRDIAGQ